MPIHLQCYITRKAENSVMNPEAYTPIVLRDREAVPPFPRTWLIAGRILRTLHTTLRVGSCMGTRLTQLASSVNRELVNVLPCSAVKTNQRINPIDYGGSWGRGLR